MAVGQSKLDQILYHYTNYIKREKETQETTAKTHALNASRVKNLNDTKKLLINELFVRNLDLQN